MPQDSDGLLDQMALLEDARPDVLSQDSEFPVRVDSSRVEVRVVRVVVDLKALARIGIDSPTSCGEGTRVTCASRGDRGH